MSARDKKGATGRKPDPAAKARNAALNLLRYRDRSVSEMRTRLLKKGYSKEIAEKTVGRLSDVGLLDDRKYAFAFAKSRASERIWGPRKLRLELRMKGIDSELIEQALDEAFSERSEVEILKHGIMRRLKGKAPESEKDVKRQIDYARRRGFSWEVIREALSGMEINED